MSKTAAEIDSGCSEKQSRLHGDAVDARSGLAPKTAHSQHYADNLTRWLPEPPVRKNRCRTWDLPAHCDERRTRQPYCVIVIVKHDHDLKLHMRKPANPGCWIAITSSRRPIKVARFDSTRWRLIRRWRKWPLDCRAIPSENNRADAFTAFSCDAARYRSRPDYCGNSRPWFDQGYLERGPGPLIEQTIRTVWANRIPSAWISNWPNWVTRARLMPEHDLCSLL